MDSSNFKDSKSLKVSFLDKLINLVNVGNGSSLEVKSSKIVAGSEPLNTNIMLATFGRIAQDDKIDRTDLIQHCLSGLGIDEFHNKRKSKAQKEKAATQVERIEPASPKENENVSTGQKEHVPNEQNHHENPASLVEQITVCNEDMSQTRIMIARIVTKPKCSDKLLGKPPFRFIHDLIMAIGDATQLDMGKIFR